MRFPDVRIMRNIRPCRRQILIWYFIRKHRFAAEDFHDRLQIPFIELQKTLSDQTRSPASISAFGSVHWVWNLMMKITAKEAEDAVAKFKEKRPDASICDRRMDERRSI